MGSEMCIRDRVYTGLLNFPSLIFCWLFWCYVTPKNIRLRASLQKIASSCNQRTEESTYCSRRFLFWLLPTGSPTKNPRRFIQKGSSQEPIVPDMNGLADGNNNTLRYFFLVHEFSRSPETMQGTRYKQRGQLAIVFWKLTSLCLVETKVARTANQAAH